MGHGEQRTHIERCADKEKGAEDGRQKAPTRLDEMETPGEGHHRSRTDAHTHQQEQSSSASEKRRRMRMIMVTRGGVRKGGG